MRLKVWQLWNSGQQEKLRPKPQKNLVDEYFRHTTYPRGTSYFTLQDQIIAVICTHECTASFLLEKTINKIIDLIPGEQGFIKI